MVTSIAREALMVLAMAMAGGIVRMSSDKQCLDRLAGAPCVGLTRHRICRQIYLC